MLFENQSHRPSAAVNKGTKPRVFIKPLRPKLSMFKFSYQEAENTTLLLSRDYRNLANGYTISKVQADVAQETTEF